MVIKSKICYNRSLEYLMEHNLLEPMIKADQLVRKLNDLPLVAQDEQQHIIKELLGSVGANPSIAHNLHCDFGCNICDIGSFNKW